MLEITIPSQELWNEITQEFITTKEYTIRLEHSLVSISKWESKWHKPYLSNAPKSTEEVIDYIRCMTLTQNVDPDAYYSLSTENLNQIDAYIKNPMTATWFSKEQGGGIDGEVVTSELIYYWMITLHIPTEFQKWHINRLLTLIKVCNIKSQPQKKMSTREIIERNKKLNEMRKQQLKTKG